jgi:hypothetical protein
VMMATCTHDNPGRGNRLYGWLKKRAAAACSMWRHARCTAEDRHTWAMAGQIYDLLQEHPGWGAHRLARALGLGRKPSNILQRIRDGWNPHKDAEWCIFTADYSLPKIAPDLRARVDVKPWLRSGAVVEQWAAADQLEAYHQRYPRDGTRRMLSVLGLNNKNYSAQVLTHIKQGWVPQTDPEWVSWVSTALIPDISAANTWATKRAQLLKSPTAGILPWLHPMVRGAAAWPWEQADKAYDLFLAGCGYVKIGQSLQAPTRNTFQVVVRKFNAGWNPHVDSDWLQWKQRAANTGICRIV